MKTSYYLRIALLVTAIGLGGCYDVGPNKTGETATSASKSSPVSIGGVVVFRERDGGFFGILSDNGGQYEPANLDPAFHTEGLHVQFTGQLDTTRLGKHNWGNPIELDRVTKQM